MTVKKKRELFLGPLLTSRGSFALPHQKTFDRCRFSHPPFRRENGRSLSPAPLALQRHETIKRVSPLNRSTPKEHQKKEKSSQHWCKYHVSYPRPGSGIL